MILDYDSQPIVPEIPTVLRRIAILLMLPSLVLPFVNYADSVSPMEVLAEVAAEPWGNPLLPLLLLLAALVPFAGIPLVFYNLRMLISGRLSKVEVWVGYVIAGLCVVPVIIFLVVAAFDGPGSWAHCSTSELLLNVAILVVPIVVLTLSILLFGLLGKHMSHSVRACACMCVSYGTFLLLCAFFFGGTPHPVVELNIGYALSLPVIVGCLIELTMLAMTTFRRQRRGR